LAPRLADGWVPSLTSDNAAFWVWLAVSTTPRQTWGRDAGDFPRMLNVGGVVMARVAEEVMPAQRERVAAKRAEPSG
jgi:hypothetical protein